MKTKIAVLVACVLMVAGVAGAEFSAAEKASLSLLRASMKSGLAVVQDHCGNADGTETDCQDILAALMKTSQCVGWLFNVNVHVSSKNGKTVLGWERSQIIDKAWEECDRAAFEYSRAASSFAADTDYQDALATLAAVDRTLSYSDPFPPFPVVPLGADPENQFGPHGEYSAAQSSLWQQMQYGHLALYGWLTGMTLGELAACPAAFFHGSKALSLGISDVWFLSAHVIDSNSFEKWLTSAEEGTREDVRRAMAELHIINGPGDDANDKSATDRLRLMGDSMALCMAETHPNLWEAWRRLNDAWARVDDWNGRFTVIR